MVQIGPNIVRLGKQLCNWDGTNVTSSFPLKMATGADWVGWFGNGSLRIFQSMSNRLGGGGGGGGEEIG